MPPSRPDAGATRTGDDPFSTTQWSLVLRAGDPDEPGAQQALAALCQRYWYPLYTYVRRRTGSPHDAEDLTQGFFEHLLESRLVGAADRERGRFRAFLLGCCNHYLSNRRDYDNAQKRPGRRVHLSVNLSDADSRYRLEPADSLTPERLYERRWALTVLDEALTRLQGACEADGKGQLYLLLRPALIGDPDAATSARVAAELGMTDDAVRKAAQRLRERYRGLVREVVGATVDSPDQVDDEVRALFSALAG
jgi:RNA polymerase sigma-70 factor (ECF subfamily)